MAHLYTREYWERDASGRATAEREWTRVFKVAYDSIVYPDEALDAPDVPRRWDAHPQDTRMLATEGVAKNLQGDPLTWIVTITYSSLTGDEDRGADDPRDRPTDIETDFIAFQSPFYYDLDGTAVLNSAGDPYDPLPQMEDSRPVLRFHRFEVDFDPARSLAYRNAVNTDIFVLGTASFAAGELMCMYIKQRRHYENDIECFETWYEFQGKANGQVNHKGVATDYKGWDAVLPDVGYNEITAGVRVLILDDTGRPVSSPVRLDGFGNAWSASATFEETAFGIHRPPYRYLPFAPLNLP